MVRDAMERRPTIYKLTKEANTERKILSMPRPFLLTATPYKQPNFSYLTRESTKYLTSTPSLSKVIFVGDVAVGKTSLVNRFCHRIFESNYKATIGVDFEVERFEMLNVNFNLQIWDTAGQERFKCIAQSYYRGAHAIVLVFSLCDPVTLKNTQTWLMEALKVNNHIPLIFLVGTKRDQMLSSPYNAIEMEAIKMANNLNAEYWSVSSKTGDCVNQFFNRLAALSFDNVMQEDFKEKRSSLIIGNPLALHQANKKKKKNCGNCKS